MKLSKRGLRGVLFYYAVIFIVIGLYFFTESVPKEIWAPIFIVIGLVLVTVLGYKFNQPTFTEGDDPQIKISLKRLSRRRK